MRATFLAFTLAACGSSPPPAQIVAQHTEEAPAQTPVDAPPVAAQRPVTHGYHGVDVIDPYEWLEASDDPEVRAWSSAENAYARRHLDALPSVAAIHDRIQAILATPSRSDEALAPRGNRLFALENRPPSEQPVIVVMSSADAPDSARVVLDPHTLDAAGGVAIDWFQPSPDGRLLAVSLSRGGSERGDVHVYDVETGHEVHETEVIEHVNGGTAGGDLAWMPDSSGFFYTRYPRTGERSAEDADFYQQLYFHQLGTPVAQDRYEIGRDFPRIAEIQLHMHAPSGRLLTVVQNGDGGEFAIHLRERNGRWRQLSNFPDGVVQASFGTQNDLYVVSRHDAPRGQIYRVPIAQLDMAHATLIVPQGEQSIVTEFIGNPQLVATRTRLIVTYQLGGPSEIRLFDLRGHTQPRPDQPPVSAINTIVPIEGEDVLYQLESFLHPPAWYRLNAANGQTHETGLRETTPVDSSHWEVRREMASSADGTQVPVNIIMPAGLAQDGSHPCVVNGYGGYGVNIEPRFRPLNALYLEHGAIFAVANLRGGAEFGESWHQAGSLTHKQNVFDDFAAAIHHMIEAHYTSSEHLAIIGGSNGGLLMGATMTQHPELPHAVVSFVGIYDMLRVELSHNGAFNVTEFGTVQNEEQFRALYAYSPYHHVQQGTAYPATLFLTGANDPRVEPWHSRKMTARLQAANGGHAPILLRTSDTSGHGIGTALSEEIAEMTDVFAFLFSQLGVRME